MGVHLVDEAAEGNHCKAAVLDLGELVSLQVGLVLSLAPDAVSAKPAQSHTIVCGVAFDAPTVRARGELLHYVQRSTGH